MTLLNVSECFAHSQGNLSGETTCMSMGANEFILRYMSRVFLQKQEKQQGVLGIMADRLTFHTVSTPCGSLLTNM